MGNSGNLHVIYMEISAEFPMKKFTGNTVAKYMGFSRVFHGMGSWDFTGNSRDFHGFCLLGRHELPDYCYMSQRPLEELPYTQEQRQMQPPHPMHRQAPMREIKEEIDNPPCP